MPGLHIPILMSYKRVLVLGDDSVALFVETRSGMELECALPWNMPNFNENLLETLTSDYLEYPVSILVDVVDQHYRGNQTLPKVNILDRSKVLKRNLAMAFSNYPVRAAMELKPPKKKGHRTPAGPKKYMFASLAETERLEQIIEVLYQAEVPIGHISLLPVESSTLVNALEKKLFADTGRDTAWSVLITQQQTGGLRQVVTKNGSLALTRITPQPESANNPTLLAEELIREFKATLSYIARFGYKQEDGLNVMVICSLEEKEALLNIGFPVPTLKCLNLPEAGRILKTTIGTQNKHYADILHAINFIKKTKPALNLPNKRAQTITTARNAARFGYFIFAMTAVAMVWFTYNNILQYRELEKTHISKQAQQEQLQYRHDQEALVFDTLPIKPDTLKGVIAVKQMLEKNSIQPTPALDALKNVLGEKIILESFNLTHTADDAMEGKTNSNRNTSSGQSPEQESGEIQMSFTFNLPDFMTLEEKVLKAEELVTQLQSAMPKHEITLTRQFGNVTRGGSFSGKIGEDDPISNTQSQSSMAEIKIIGEPIWSN